MRKPNLRARTRRAAVVTVTALFLLSTIQVSSASAGGQLWEARYDGPAPSEQDNDDASFVAVSPDGARVYVTGISNGAGATSGNADYATVASDTSTGEQLWVARYNGPGDYFDYAYSAAVSFDGARVYVTGTSYGSGTDEDYATVAYEASTGAQLWAARYNGPGTYGDRAYSVAVSPDGTRVTVTGISFGAGTYSDYATVAYDASTGEQIWVARYGDTGLDRASFLAASPDGARIYVTGTSTGSGTFRDYATIAYDASTGEQIWVARYDGSGIYGDYASSVAVSPDGARVYTTGGSDGSGTYSDYATIAYDAPTGAQLWVARYDGPGNATDSATSLAVSPDGTRIHTTGHSEGAGTGQDYATLAYDASTGAHLWVSRYGGPGDADDRAVSLAVSPDGARVYATGYSEGLGTYYNYDYTTVAYDASTGALPLGVARYKGQSNSSYDLAYSLAVSPDGARVYVTGSSDRDYATVAYDTHEVWGPGQATVAPSATVSPSSVGFAPEAVGSPSAPAAVTVTSSGSAPLTVWSVTLTGAHAADFSLPSDACTGATLLPTASCVVHVVFTPTAAGARTATLSIASTAPDSPHSVSLSGYGDGTTPTSAFTTPEDSVLLGPTATVEGTATDDTLGVSTVSVTWIPAVGLSTTTQAALTCNVSRTSCTWTAAVPLVPGLYTAWSRATDRGGLMESPGPTRSFVVV